MQCKYTFTKLIPAAMTAVVKYSKDGVEPLTRRIQVDGFDEEQLIKSAERMIPSVISEWDNMNLIVDESIIGREFDQHQSLQEINPDPVYKKIRFIFIDSNFKVINEGDYFERPEQYLTESQDCIIDEKNIFSVGSTFSFFKLPSDATELSRNLHLSATRGQIDYACHALGMDIDYFRTKVKSSANIVLSSFINANYSTVYAANCPEVRLFCDMLKILPRKVIELFKLATSINMDDPFAGLEESQSVRLSKYLEDKKAKIKKQNAIDTAVVEVNGNVYQANDESIARISNKINACEISGTESVNWKMNDNTTVLVPVLDLKKALVLATDNIEKLITG